MKLFFSKFDLQSLKLLLYITCKYVQKEGLAKYTEVFESSLANFHLKVVFIFNCQYFVDDTLLSFFGRFSGMKTSRYVLWIANNRLLWLKSGFVKWVHTSRVNLADYGTKVGSVREVQFSQSSWTGQYKKCVQQYSTVSSGFMKWGRGFLQSQSSKVVFFSFFRYFLKLNWRICNSKPVN